MFGMNHDIVAWSVHPLSQGGGAGQPVAAPFFLENLTRMEGRWSSGRQNVAKSNACTVRFEDSTLSLPYRASALPSTLLRSSNTLDDEARVIDDGCA